jgi:hypothetical protein
MDQVVTLPMMRDLQKTPTMVSMIRHGILMTRMDRESTIPSRQQDRLRAMILSTHPSHHREVHRIPVMLHPLAIQAEVLRVARFHNRSLRSISI